MQIYAGQITCVVCQPQTAIISANGGNALSSGSGGGGGGRILVSAGNILLFHIF